MNVYVITLRIRNSIMI